jgi:hypothetical protein
LRLIEVESRIPGGLKGCRITVRSDICSIAERQYEVKDKAQQQQSDRKAFILAENIIPFNRICNTLVLFGGKTVVSLLLP